MLVCFSLTSLYKASTIERSKFFEKLTYIEKKGKNENGRVPSPESIFMKFLLSTFLFMILALRKNRLLAKYILNDCILL